MTPLSYHSSNLWLIALEDMRLLTRTQMKFIHKMQQTSTNAMQRL